MDDATNTASGENQITVTALAECPFSIAQEYATEYLRNAEAGGPEATMRVPWQLPVPEMRRRVQLSFGLHLDVLEAGRRHDEVRLRWSAGSRLFPRFRGTLRFRIEGQNTRIVIDGSYRPPWGRAGRLFDRVIGNRIAHRTLQDLADRLACSLRERERAWREKSLANERVSGSGTAHDCSA